MSTIDINVRIIQVPHIPIHDVHANGVMYLSGKCACNEEVNGEDEGYEASE